MLIYGRLESRICWHCRFFGVFCPLFPSVKLVKLWDEWGWHTFADEWSLTTGAGACAI